MCVHMCVHACDTPSLLSAGGGLFWALEQMVFQIPKGQGNQSKCLLKTPVPGDVGFRGCG